MRTIHTPATTRGRQEARLGSAKACDMRRVSCMPTGDMHTFNMAEKRGWWWALAKAHVEGRVLEPLECVAEVSKTGDLR